MIRLHSLFPRTVYQVLLEDSTNNALTGTWYYTEDINIEHILGDERHNLRFITTMLSQGTHFTLSFGAGKKDSTIKESIQNHLLTNGSTESMIESFSNESGKLPIKVHCCLESNKFSMCARAAIVNLTAALGSFNLADKVEEAMWKMPDAVSSEYFVQPPSESVAADEVSYSLWLFRVICKGRAQTIMTGKKWPARVLMDKTASLHHPVLIEMTGTPDNLRSHVVILFDGHIYCAETMTSYPMSMKNLNYSCGSRGHYDYATNVIALIPHRDMKITFDEYRLASGECSYDWSRDELSSFSYKKQKRSRKRKK